MPVFKYKLNEYCSFVFPDSRYPTEMLHYQITHNFNDIRRCLHQVIPI